MSLATVVIPISPEHGKLGYVKDAIESVKAQTIPCELITIHDHDKRGAAWARNQGTAQVQTPFVIWLDADDILLPSFVECTVKAYQLGAYVYTDWRLHGKDRIVPPALSPFTQGQEHVITTLMPVAAWRDTGGFDESLDTLEDEDFYRKLHAYGWRGVKAEGVLIDYRRNLGFSKVNSEAVDPDIQKARVLEKQSLFEKRYRRFENMLVFVSARQKPQTEIVGERCANDVLCEANYSPMTQAGAVTHRKYPRAGLGEPIWVDHDDALARPDLWRIIAHNPDKIAPDVERVKELYERARTAKEFFDGYAMPTDDDWEQEIKNKGVFISEGKPHIHLVSLQHFTGIDANSLRSGDEFVLDKKWYKVVTIYGNQAVHSASLEEIIPAMPETLPDKAPGYDGMLLEQLRQEFAKRDLNEIELTGGVTVHWKILRKLMINRLKDWDDEKVHERTQTPVENP